MLWDRPKPGTKLSTRQTRLWSVFMCRLTARRKMRYAREKKDKAQANNGADQYDVDTLAQQSTPDALKELESIDSAVKCPASVNVPYVVKLLKVTFEERKGTVLDKLPVYFLNAECLLAECELHFAMSFTSMKGVCTSILEGFGKDHGIRQATLMDVQAFLRSRSSRDDALSTVSQIY
ncbi:uncharacterized protein ISCGN_010153 [Ixodes scapularis]